MEELIRKYVRKLEEQGLSDPEDTLLGFLDQDVVWSRFDAAAGELEQVFEAIAVNAVLLAQPKEPYRTIIDFLAAEPAEVIEPKDSETRTFLHDLPIVRSFSAERIASALSSRKCAIIPGHGVVTAGAVSPEQTFIHFSSVCFAAFVTFFSELFQAARSGGLNAEARQAFERAVSRLDAPPSAQGIAEALAPGPFRTEDQVVEAMDQAGKEVVRRRLVDSFFGNISYRLGETLYISQTSSSLDELKGCIDPCPLDGSSSAAVTASSELTAHRDMLSRTGCLAGLHGHPKFAVVMSMPCQAVDCEMRGECHRRCPRERSVCGIPIVSGEVGTGPFGLCHTVPPALESHGGAIVFGHGVFTVGRADYIQAMTRLVEIEAACRAQYFRTLEECLR